MSHADDEGLSGLPGQGPSTPVDNRSRNQDSDRLVLGLEERLDGEDGGFAVGRVEDRLDEENVDAAVQKSSNLLGVR